LVVEKPEAEVTSESEAAETESLDRGTAPWSGAPAPLVEPERYASRTNGGSEHGASPHDAAHKTLEDSVKDMLRPMLRQWLDENMPRVINAALKDELGDRGVRGQGD
jgi:cell pole-organizing protein PopZ